MDVTKWFPDEAKKALTNTSSNVISEIGHEVVVDVVHDVLIGENLRNSTELLTRKRLLTLNAALLYAIIKGSATDPDFVIKLHDRAARRLLDRRVPKEEKWILEWLLGLTDKAFQNVLRDDTGNLDRYKQEYNDVIAKSIQEFEKDYGTLSGQISVDGANTKINWLLMANLMTAVGSQTLAVRGSDKSTFGKLFEKLILGSLLKILGFEQVTPDDIGSGQMVFWLSERKERRESDATILIKKGQGVRFDIGFIGRGNPEISLDKVSRFEREIELNSSKYYMSTIVIVDRIGANSRIEELAKRIDGNIVQMSGSYWPKKVAQLLEEKFGYKDEILDKTGVDLQELIRKRLDKVDFTQLVEKAFEEQ